MFLYFSEPAEVNKQIPHPDTGIFQMPLGGTHLSECPFPTFRSIRKESPVYVGIEMNIFRNPRFLLSCQALNNINYVITFYIQII